jgi:hypothetical protein
MLFEPDLIVAALSTLIGQPLRDWGRAMDMQLFGFGEKRTRVIRFGRRKGESAEVCVYSLHVNCEWRVRGSEGIVAGRMDMFERSSAELEQRSDEWDPHAEGAISRCDERMNAWIERGPYEVLRVDADVVGGFSLGLAGGCALEVFPTSSRDDDYCEHWRLLRPDDSHCVVGGCGISD